MNVTEEQLRGSAFHCWLKAEQESSNDLQKRWRYHELMVEYGHLITVEEDDGGPRFACGWDPDPMRRVAGTV